MKLYIRFGWLTGIILGFLITLFGVKVETIRYTAYAANNFSDDKTIFFTIDTDEQEKNKKIFSELDWVQAEFTANYFAVNFKGNRCMPMISGDFFKNTQGHDYNIVIGKSYYEKTFFIDDCSFIEINSIKFHVCGIIGMDTPSPLDKNIYFLLPEVSEWCKEGTLFSTNDRSVLQNPNINVVQKKNPNLTYVLRYEFYVIILIILLFSGILISVFHALSICENRVEENLLLSTLGYSNFQKSIFNMKIYLFEYAIFYIIGFLVAMPLFYKKYYSIFCIILIILIFFVVFLIGYGCVLLFGSENRRISHGTYNN